MIPDTTKATTAVLPSPLSKPAHRVSLRLERGAQGAWGAALSTLQVASHKHRLRTLAFLGYWMRPQAYFPMSQLREIGSLWEGERM